MKLRERRRGCEYPEDESDYFMGFSYNSNYLT